jgi:hypothetical protein
MRFTIVAATFVLVALSAHAKAEPATGQTCIAMGPGMARVAAKVANPADCCTGRMQCAQYLSTTTVVRPAHDQRT